MMAFRFQDPLWLLLLAPLAALVYWRVLGRTRATVVYSETSIPAALPVTLATRVQRVLRWAPVAVLLLTIVALARPQWGEEEFRVRTEGVAIEMCLDRSGSMQARDFVIDKSRVNRLQAVKHVFENFVEGDDDLPGRPDDKIGLISFAGYPDSKCPLTLDHTMLLDMLDAVKLYEPIYDEQGRWINERLQEDEMSTAIGDAIGLAVERLRNCEAKSRVIVLLSDGESNAGVLDPIAAAELAKQLGIKIHTIGVGGSGLAPIPIVDSRTGRVVREEPVQVRLDEAALREIAKIAGGQYFNAKDTQSLEEVYARIDAMEKTKHEGRVYTQYAELYGWMLFPALGLLLVQQVLASTRFRTLP